MLTGQVHLPNKSSPKPVVQFFHFMQGHFWALPLIFYSECPCLYLDLKVFPLCFSLVFQIFTFELISLNVERLESSFILLVDILLFLYHLLKRLSSPTYNWNFCLVSDHCIYFCILYSSLLCICLCADIMLCCWLALYVCVAKVCSINKSKTLQSMQSKYKVYAVGYIYLIHCYGYIASCHTLDAVRA